MSLVPAHFRLWLWICLTFAGLAIPLHGRQPRTEVNETLLWLPGPLNDAQMQALKAATEDPMPEVQALAVRWSEAAEVVRHKKRRAKLVAEAIRPEGPLNYWGWVNDPDAMELWSAMSYGVLDKLDLAEKAVDFTKHGWLIRLVLDRGPPRMKLVAAHMLHRHGEPGMESVVEGLLTEGSKDMASAVVSEAARHSRLIDDAQRLRAATLMLVKFAPHPDMPINYGDEYSRAALLLSRKGGEAEKEVLRAQLKSESMDLLAAILEEVDRDSLWLRREEILPFLNDRYPDSVTGPAILALARRGTAEDADLIAGYIGHKRLTADAVTALGILRATRYAPRIRALADDTDAHPLLRAHAVIALGTMGEWDGKVAAETVIQFIRDVKILRAEGKDINMLMKYDIPLPMEVPEGSRIGFYTEADLKLVLTVALLDSELPWEPSTVAKILPSFRNKDGIVYTIIGKLPHRALKRLEPQLTSPDESAQLGAAWLLGTQSRKEYVPALARALPLAQTAQSARGITSALDALCTRDETMALARGIPAGTFQMTQQELARFLISTPWDFEGAGKILRQAISPDTAEEDLFLLLDYSGSLQHYALADRVAALIRPEASPELIAAAFDALRRIEAASYRALAEPFLKPLPGMGKKGMRVVEAAVEFYFTSTRVADLPQMFAAVKSGAFSAEEFIRRLDWKKLAEESRSAIVPLADIAGDEEMEADTRAEALYALWEAEASEQEDLAVRLLHHPNPRVAWQAENLLFSFGVKASPKNIIPFLADRRSERREDAARILLRQGEAPEAGLAMLAAAAGQHPESEDRAPYLATAWLIYGNHKTLRGILPWIGGRAATERPAIPAAPQAAARVINSLRDLAKLAGGISSSKSQYDALKVAAEIAEGVHWAATDTAALRGLQEDLTRLPDAAHLVQKLSGVIEGAESRHPARRALRALLAIVIFQPLVWVLLLLLYPWWRPAQRVVWSRGARRWLGLGWVGPVILHTRWLRDWLWRPYREELVLPEDTVSFDEWTFFDGVQLTAGSGDRRYPALSTLRGWSGTSVLSGASGLGKTTLLQALAGIEGKPVALLRAADCPQGIPAALAARLPVQADAGFLRELLGRGSPAVLVDAMHETTGAVQEAILASLPQGARVLLSTQPTGWVPSADTLVWHLQPLRPRDLRDFLLKQGAVAVEATRGEGLAERHREFAERVDAFLQDATALPPDSAESAAMRAMLANPMEAVLCAELLAAGQTPQPQNLLRQRLEQFVTGYTRETGDPFPAEALAASIQRSRREGTDLFSLDGLGSVADFLARHRLLRTCPGKGWRFRHDKIMEWFAGALPWRPVA